MREFFLIGLRSVSELAHLLSIFIDRFTLNLV